MSDLVPRYPGSVPLNGQAVSSPAGGSGRLQNWATTDPLDTVVAFFAARLGARVDAPAEPGGPIAWHLSAPDGGEHHVEVWPADAPYPFRDDVVLPPPPGARTVIHESSYLRAPGAGDELAHVATRWRPPAIAWWIAALLVLLAIAAARLILR